MMQVLVVWRVNHPVSPVEAGILIVGADTGNFSELVEPSDSRLGKSRSGNRVIADGFGSKWDGEAIPSLVWVDIDG